MPMLKSASRKLMLVIHVTGSVGLLGAIAGFLTLALCALADRPGLEARLFYPAMEIVTLYVIVPLAFTALVSGIVQALGTRWGLFRHQWVLAKLLLTLSATAILLVKLDLIRRAARLALQAPFSADQRFEIGIQLAVHAAGGLLVLLVPVILSIYKPWGLTRYGRKSSGVSPPDTR